MKQLLNRWFTAFAIVLLLIVVTTMLWSSGWLLTSIGEYLGQLRLGRRVEISHLEYEGKGSYSLTRFKVYNKPPVDDIALCSFQSIFLQISDDSEKTVKIDHAECCNGDLYIIAWQDGRTNIDNFPISFSGNLSMCNIRLHINSPDAKPNEELVMTLNGSMKVAPGGKLEDINMKIVDRSGKTIANIIKNPTYNPDISVSSTNLPFKTEGFSMSDILMCPDSMLILKYYPALSNITQRYKDKNNN